MAEYFVLVVLALLPGYHCQWKRVRGKLRLVEVRVFWPRRSSKHTPKD
jgi:hypothetical protein